MKIKERSYTLPDGRVLQIRSACGCDALRIKRHREATAAETHFLAREPEDGQMDGERIRSILEIVEKSGTDFMVTAFCGDEVVGDLGVTQVRPLVKYAHRAYLGMSIRQEYTGMGLGSFMLKTALEQAAENGFEQVELGVFSDNETARHVYGKFGFAEYGKMPRAFKLRDGTYRDEIIMVKMPTGRS